MRETHADHKVYPPGRGNISVPVSSRQAALAGLALYPACRILPLAAHRLAWTWTAVLGGRWLPGPLRQWQPPMEADRWTALCTAWEKTLGPFDAQAVYQRPQATRTGLAALLLRAGRPVAFVKLCRAEDDAVTRELRALKALEQSKPTSFSAPRPLISNIDAGWHWLAMTPLPVRFHSPVRRPPLDSILHEVRAALVDIPRPESMPEHWQPMHGDFTPWNLRRVAGSSMLIDWEEAGWGPPGADEVYYQVTWAVIRGRAVTTSGNTEAVHFWLDRLARYDGDDWLRSAMAAALSSAAHRQDAQHG